MKSSKSPFEIERNGEVAVITLSPDLDEMHEKDMEAAAVLVLRPLEDKPPDGLIFNLGRVNYMKSLVLSFLLRCHRRVKPSGCQVVVAQLHTTALDTIWPIYDTLPEALQALRD
ncbi:MAG: STAS domain-containing protein [Planctomycetota bacterium]|nr:STAS domain-containing protein [Planctomycetota bacterium]